MFKFLSATSLLVASVFLAQSAYAGNLSCTISTAAACTGGTNTILLKMSGESNAHAATPISGTYDPTVVCCSGPTGLSNSCATGGATTTLLWLAGSTNAHSAQTQTNGNYTDKLCLGAGTGGTVSVAYQATNCNGYDTTVASMKAVTNSHVGTSTAYSEYKICASATSTPAGLNASGTLTSSLFDSTATTTGGAGYNSIMWDGTLGAGGTGKVRFQFATSDSTSGPWTYIGGANCDGSTWFDATTPLTPVELKGATCQTAWNNKRYYRYKIQICSSDCTASGTYTPTVTKVVVNWTP